MRDHVEALRRAIAIAGGQKQLAESISQFLDRPTFKQQTVSYWLRNGTRLGAEWWPAIEHATNSAVTRADLRPDVFAEAA